MVSDAAIDRGHGGPCGHSPQFHAALEGIAVPGPARAGLAPGRAGCWPTRLAAPANLRRRGIRTASRKRLTRSATGPQAARHRGRLTPQVPTPTGGLASFLSDGGRLRRDWRHQGHAAAKGGVIERRVHGMRTMFQLFEGRLM